MVKVKKNCFVYACVGLLHFTLRTQPLHIIQWSEWKRRRGKRATVKHVLSLSILY